MFTNDTHVLHITTVPPGEAPVWVRRAWVGIRIPISASQAAPREFRTVGVLSGAKSFLTSLIQVFSGNTEIARGYRVRVLDAIAALAPTQPEAAQWWRDNTPHLFSFGGALIFPEYSGVIESTEDNHPQ